MSHSTICSVYQFSLVPLPASLIVVFFLFFGSSGEAFLFAPWWLCHDSAGFCHVSCSPPCLWLVVGTCSSPCVRTVSCWSVRDYLLSLLQPISLVPDWLLSQDPEPCLIFYLCLIPLVPVSVSLVMNDILYWPWLKPLIQQTLLPEHLTTCVWPQLIVDIVTGSWALHLMFLCQRKPKDFQGQRTTSLAHFSLVTWTLWLPASG